MGKKERKQENETLRQIFRVYLWPQKGRLAVIALLILLGVLLGNLSPYLYGKMVDAINAGDLKKLAALIGGYCAVTLTTLGMSLLEKYLGEICSFKMVHSMKQTLFEKVVYAKTQAYQQFSLGEYLSRLNGDAESVIDFFINLITNIGQITMNLAVSLGFILGISLRLSSVAIFYLPASFLVSHLARKYYKKLAKKQRETEDKQYGFLAEILANHLGVKAFQMERKAMVKYQSIVKEKYSLVKRSVRLGNVVTILTSTVQLISSMYIIYMSALLIKNGTLTLGIMVSFNTYINVMFTSVSQIWNFHINQQTMLAVAGRIAALLDMETEEQQQGRILSDGAMGLRAKGVSFCYPDGEKLTLQGVEFEISSPGLYGIVGKNGCGKSTLAKLLVGFYQSDGILELAKHPVKEYSLESLRQAITYIQRDDFFLRDTIQNNLLLANPHAGWKEIEAVCRQAGAHDFIMALPEGYFTIIGEGGSTLSSGQKQKLSLARALLRDSSVLILDEITANLDGAAEHQVLKVLAEQSHQKIILVISHKASVTAVCDQVFVLDQGKVIDSGKHEQLLERCTVYQEIFRQRFDV